MRFTTIVLPIVLVLALVSSRRAEACGTGGGDWGGVVAAVLIVGGTYVGATATVAIKDVATSDHSVGYGIAETAVNAPLTLMFGAAMVNEIRDPNTDHSGATTLGVFTALHGALLAHGI